MMIKLFSVLSTEDSEKIIEFIKKQEENGNVLGITAPVSDLLRLIIMNKDIATFDTITKYDVDVNQFTKNKSTLLTAASHRGNLKNI